jgi:hypothetical protein
VTSGEYLHPPPPPSSHPTFTKLFWSKEIAYLKNIHTITTVIKFYLNKTLGGLKIISMIKLKEKKSLKTYPYPN